MKELTILGVYLEQRHKNSASVQNVLTKFGCNIKTRVGLHDILSEEGETTGLILLELTGDTQDLQKLENELLKIDHVQVRKMRFAVG